LESIIGLYNHYIVFKIVFRIVISIVAIKVIAAESDTGLRFQYIDKANCLEAIFVGDSTIGATKKHQKYSHQPAHHHSLSNYQQTNHTVA